MNRDSEHENRNQTFSQVDDNQDEYGRDVNNPGNKIGDRATVDKTKQDAAHEASKKAGLERGRKRSDGQADNVSGGFNQKH